VQIKPFIDFTNPDDIVYWSAIIIAHFLLLRAGEFVVTDFSRVTLCANDLHINTTSDGHEYMSLRIAQSKTDQNRQGFTLYTGYSKHSVCAICAMKANLRIQNQLKSVNQLGHLFCLSSGSAITRHELQNVLASILRLLGLTPDLYSTHSFRIGGATSAAIAGLNDYEIKLIGR